MGKRTAKLHTRIWSSDFTLRPIPTEKEAGGPQSRCGRGVLLPPGIEFGSYNKYSITLLGELLRFKEGCVKGKNVTVSLGLIT
jgi:hypothetical protein